MAVVDAVASDDDAALTTRKVVDRQVVAAVVGVGDRPPGQKVNVAMPGIVKLLSTIGGLGNGPWSATGIS